MSRVRVELIPTSGPNACVAASGFEIQGEKTLPASLLFFQRVKLFMSSRIGGTGVFSSPPELRVFLSRISPISTTAFPESLAMINAL